MTEAFARAHSRNGFGSPLPVSESLLEMSDEPFMANLERPGPYHRSDEIDLLDPRTILDRPVAEGMYNLPPLEDMLRVSRSLPAELSARFEASQAYAEYRDAWERFSMTSPFLGNVMSVEWAVALGLYFEKQASSRKAEGAMVYLYPSSVAPALSESWMDEMTPMAFDAFTVPINRTLQRFGHVDSVSEMTVGEVLHVVRRHPGALVPGRYFSAIRDELSKGREMLLPIVGEAWFSFLILASTQQMRFYADNDEIRAFAVELASLGAEVEELQPYVRRFNEMEPIRHAWTSGLSVDMLDSLATTED